MLKLTLTSNLCKRILTFETVSLRRKMSSDSNDVIIEDFGCKGVLTLNRPKALNALNLSMLKKILPTFIKWNNEKEIVIIKGAGDRAFCAGGDVKVITEHGLKGDTKLGEEFFKWEYRNNALIGRYNPTYIALIDGITMGGGVGLSVHGKYRVATERTLFAMPETAIGLFPDVGGSYFLPRLQGKLGLYLALTGYRLKGSDVTHSGIATHFVDSACLPDLLKDLTKGETKKGDVENILNKYSKPMKEFTLCNQMDKINKCFGASTVEGIIQCLEKDGSDWAKKQIETLCKMSPTSMKVSKTLLERSKGMNLDECMKLEYRVAVNTLNRSEFYEGVRALLIDKDQNPKWKPGSLEDVTDEIIEAHFASLPCDKELKHKL